MLSSSEERVLEQILENLNQGIVYVDQERKIRLCNKKAKEITGITTDDIGFYAFFGGYPGKYFKNRMLQR